jgi:hypothetical protein
MRPQTPPGDFQGLTLASGVKSTALGYVGLLDAAVAEGTLTVDAHIGVKHVDYAKVMASQIKAKPRASGADTAKKKKRKQSEAVRESDDGQKPLAEITPEEQQELRRQQSEVLYHIQTENVVIVIDPTQDPVPYKRQGDPTVNTPTSLRRRHGLRSSPLIREIVEEYWSYPALQSAPTAAADSDSRCIDKAAYCLLSRKLHLALVPTTPSAEAEAAADADWGRDTRRSAGAMDFATFYSSLFELADIWTEVSQLYAKITRIFSLLLRKSIAMSYQGAQQTCVHTVCS